MKQNKRLTAALMEVGGLLLVLALAAYGQGKEGLPFPEALLGGDTHFDLALHLQGDIRGNVGPCG